MVITMPIAQIAAVFVTFKRDLVRASNIFVIVTPPKLKTEITTMPVITSPIKYPLSITYLK